jgi:hypothetical protein
MLHAIHQNKAGRGLHESLDWRALFKGCEDTLTSAVFSNLFHLPPALFWQLLNESFFKLQLPVAPDTQLLSYQFWPRWDATGTANARNVEPDIFIHTSSFDLIVEAKRHDVLQQYEEQWSNEVGSYFNEYKTSKTVFLLAVGGFDAGDEEPELIQGGVGEAWVFKCRWRNLLGAARHMRAQLGGEDWSVGNILDDVIMGFSLHGFTVTDWFATLPREQLDKLRLGNSFDLFQAATTAF